MTRRVVFAWILLLLVGCEGGGNSDTPPSPIPSNAGLSGNTATLVVRQTIESRAVPDSVDSVRITGLISGIIDGLYFIDGGGVGYGPLERPLAPEYRFRDVPVEVDSIKLEYIDGSQVVGLYYQAVALAPGGVLEIVDPAFATAEDFPAVEARIESIYSATRPGRPPVVPVGPWGAGAFLVAPNATEPDPSLLAFTVWSSSDESIAVVHNGGSFHGSDFTGLVTGVRPGLATLTGRYFHLEASTTVEIIELPRVFLSEIILEDDQALGQFRARGLFRDGTTGQTVEDRDITEEVEWVAGDPSVVNISNTPGQKGRYTILSGGDSWIGTWWEPTKYWHQFPYSFQL